MSLTTFTWVTGSTLLEILNLKRKKAAPVKTVYQRQITQASTTGIVDIIKTLAATGIDDKTLGSVVRSLL